MPTPDIDAELKTRIAWLYHVEGMTQDEIAREVGLNRSRVLRILANARQDGTVQIRVTTKQSRCVALAQALQKRWRLKQAIVIPEPQDADKINSIIGAELGAWLTQHVEPDMTIGLGWGRTLSAGLAAIEPRGASGIRVVSLLGGLTKVNSINPSEFAWRVADKLSAECYLMAAPVFAPSPEIRQALMGHSGIKEIFHRAAHLDMAIVSVGDLTPRSIFWEYGLLTREEIVSLERAGAIGDVLCRFVDAEGKVVDHPVNDRVLAVDPQDLSDTRHTVLASGGWQKLGVIRAALNCLRPTVLITNETVAERLAGETEPGIAKA